MLKMVKSFEKIFIIILVVSLAFGMIGFNYSYATEATISVSSAKVNQEFTVTVNIPSEAIGYEGKIEVTFSDNTTQSSGKLVNITGISGDFAHPGNMTAKFTASSSGTAKIKVTDLHITTKEGTQVNSNTTLEQTINVEAVTQTTEQTTTNSTTTSTTPSTPTTTPSTTTTDGATYTSTGDTVYTLERLNVRKSASASADKLGTLSKGDSTKRIAVGSNGWDKIEYNGTTGYVVSKYLTTQKPTSTTNTTVANNTTDNNTTNTTTNEPSWTATGDTVYSLKSLNVREGWGTSYKSIGSLSVGQKATRIAVGSNGWDKIKYDGKEAYVLSKYLTTSKDEADKLVEELEAKQQNEVQNNTTEENSVTENTAQNTVTNEEIYNVLVDEIGVLPQVGRSIASYIYIMGVIIAIILISVVGLKIRQKDEE
jgi:uncharacterized protein YgiM (DUF1202 family)